MFIFSQILPQVPLTRQYYAINQLKKINRLTALVPSCNVFWVSQNDWNYIWVTSEKKNSTFIDCIAFF